MATIADYQVLFDGRFTLGGNVNSKILKFTMPSNLAFTTAKAKLIIAFKITPVTDIQLKIEMNFREVMTTNSFHESLTRGHWTIFDPSRAFPEGTSFPSEVDVKFISNDGTVHIDDVVIWYQVNQ